VQWVRLSFLVTAAGQSRNYTGFPVVTPVFETDEPCDLSSVHGWGDGVNGDSGEARLKPRAN